MASLLHELLHCSTSYRRHCGHGLASTSCLILLFQLLETAQGSDEVHSRRAPIAARGGHEPRGSIADGLQQGVTSGGRARMGQDLVERPPVLKCDQRLDERHYVLGAVASSLQRLRPGDRPRGFGITAGQQIPGLPRACGVRIGRGVAGNGGQRASLIHLAHVCERASCDQGAVADELTLRRGFLRVSRHMFLGDREHLVPAPEVV